MPTKYKLLIAAAIVALVALFAGFILWFNGGIRPILDGILPTPDPTSKKLITKREAANDSIAKEFRLIESSMNFNSGLSSSYDHCYKGQNNSKVHSGYSNKCDLLITKYYGSTADFRQEMMKLHQMLRDDGWTSKNVNNLPYYLVNYYDTGRQISNIPIVMSGYTKAQDTITISYAEKDANDIFWLKEMQTGISRDGMSTHEDKRLQDVQSLFDNLVQTNNFVVGITIENNYFKN